MPRIYLIVGAVIALGFLPAQAQVDPTQKAPNPDQIITPANPSPGTSLVQPPATDSGVDQPSGASGDEAAQPGSDESVTFQTFYDALGSEGSWIQTPQYGYVWQPNVTDPNWAPYTDGQWYYTQDGWTWGSNEPWGWATYHYGRWVNLDGTGWVWVPGYVWAPAWVSWRYGDGYVAWAPLPPDSLVGPDYSDNSAQNTDDSGDVDDGFHIGDDVDGYYGIGAGWYVFLPIIYFCGHDYHHHYCDRNDNYSLINHTQNVTNINLTR